MTHSVTVQNDRQVVPEAIARTFLDNTDDLDTAIVLARALTWQADSPWHKT
jgi:hypothetical protein